jgi:hypothetical protein
VLARGRGDHIGFEPCDAATAARSLVTST